MTSTRAPKGRQRWQHRGTALCLLLVALCLLAPAAAHAAPGWLAMQDVQPGGDTKRSTKVSVAFDGQSNAVPVWEDSKATGSIRSATRPAGGGWSAPETISADEGTTTEPHQPVVVSDRRGNTVAVWQRYDAASRLYVVRAASRAAGSTTWSVQSLSTPSRFGAYPQVAIDGEGNAVAIWQATEGGQDGAHYFVQAATRPAGGGLVGDGWSSPRTLLSQSLTGTTGGYGERLIDGPQVAIDGDGNAVAIWSRPFTFGGAIEVAMRPRGGGTTERDGWTGPQVISRTGEQGSGPHVAVNSRGDAAAVWYRNTGTYAWNANVVPVATTRPAGRSWSAPQDLAPVPDLSTTDVITGPRVAIDGQGNAVALWGTYDGQTSGLRTLVQAATRPAPTPSVTDPPWSSPQDLSVFGQNGTDPELAMDEHGDAVAVWARHSGSAGVTQAASRPAGDSWADAQWSAPRDLSDPNPVGSTTRADARFPQVAMDWQGNAVVTWSLDTSQGDTVGPTLIQSAGYDAAGPQLRDLQVPNEGTVGSPLSFSVAPVDVWSAPASTPSWSFGDGASASGESVSHTYAAPGSYEVTVTSKDRRENVSSAKRTVTVAAPGGGGPLAGGFPSLGSAVTSATGAPQSSGGAELAGPALASETRRARDLRSCLASAARSPRGARRTSVRARRRAAALRRAARRRCLKRYARTPGKVTGLGARALSSSKILLSFLAPGTDGSNPPAARSYLVRQSARPIRSARDFARAQTLCGGACRFSVTRVGTNVSLTITELRAHSGYYYAVAARDNVSGRLGPRSQAVGARTP